jgi:hypothetical protein
MCAEEPVVLARNCDEKVPDFLKWQKHNPDRYLVYDGDVYLCAVEVLNKSTGKSTWEVVKLRISCDWDGDSGFFDLIHEECADGTIYDDWGWEDFEWSIKLE